MKIGQYSMISIILTQGYCTHIDDSDKDQSRYSWYAAVQKNGIIYAQRSLRKPKRHTVHLHREIMQVANNIDVDHIDGNGLNNQRSNLRVATRTQNSQNRRIEQHSSKYKGVLWYKRTSKWIAKITFNGKRIHLGYFNSELEAAKAYNAKAIELFGEFARINIIED